MPRKHHQLDHHLIYYCYALFDWCGIPRWIGKGKGKRMHDHEKHTDPSNWRKNEFIEQTWIMFGEIPKIIIQDKLCEADAFALEILLISTIGREDQGKGPLTNISDGGEGASGHIVSENAKRSIGEGQRITWENRTPEQRLTMTDHMRAGIKDKSAVAKKAGKASAASRTIEQKRDFYNRGLGKLTPEERSYLGKNYGYAQLTPEQRSAAGRKGQANRTTEQRSINVKKGWSEFSPEERTARLKAAWVTRKRNSCL